MEQAQNKLEIITRFFSDFSEEQLHQLAALEAIYKDWNEKINVISRKDIDSLYEKHVLHSLAIAAVFDFADGIEILDIGTGGGFPGVPLAIMFPHIKFHLVDSVGKKLKVIEAVVEELHLKNITVQHTRVEQIQHRKFDFVVSRAVAPLKDLWSWAKPLLKKERKMADFTNGLICLKGGDLRQEIADSRLRPHSWKVEELFNDIPSLQEKFVLYVPL